MTEPETVDAQERLEDRHERIAVALERIAEHFGDSADRIEQLEDLLRDVVRMMENPQSTNDMWAELLEEAKAAIGVV